MSYSLLRGFLPFVLLVHHGNNAFVVNAAWFVEFFLKTSVSEIIWKSSSAEPVCDLRIKLYFILLIYENINGHHTEECNGTKSKGC